MMHSHSGQKELNPAWWVTDPLPKKSLDIFLHNPTPHDSSRAVTPQWEQTAAIRAWLCSLLLTTGTATIQSCSPFPFTSLLCSWPKGGGKLPKGRAEAALILCEDAWERMSAGTQIQLSRAVHGRVIQFLLLLFQWNNPPPSLLSSTWAFSPSSGPFFHGGCHTGTGMSLLHTLLPPSKLCLWDSRGYQGLSPTGALCG